ncbi:MAG: hypothetical protein ACETWG_12480 [Candidatus Neomarinimicrobiota bacterium]
MKEKSLLTLDAAVNLALGLPLMLIPASTARFLAIPLPEPTFYASILGAVLTGIGLALLVERFHERFRMSGLGLGGAITINIVGAGVLIIWLLWGSLDIPLRGYAFLWAVAVVVLGISLVEIQAYFRRGSPKNMPNPRTRKE